MTLGFSGSPRRDRKERVSWRSIHPNDIGARMVASYEFGIQSLMALACAMNVHRKPIAQ